MMKRVGVIVLCLILALSLCACDLAEMTEEQEVSYVSVAQASMYVMNISREYDDGSYTGISASGIEASRLLVDECVVLIKSNRVMNEIVEAYRVGGGKHVPDADALRAALQLESVEETSLMQVTVYPFAEGVTDEELLMMCETVLTVAPPIIEQAMAELVSVVPFDVPTIQQAKPLVEEAEEEK